MANQMRRIDRAVHESEVAEAPRRPSPTVLRTWFERVDGRFMGSPIDVPPHEAILWAMKIAAGEVAYCEEQISRLQEDELFERPLKTTIVEMPSGGEETITEVRDAEVMSRWVTWRDSAADRMAKFAKMALDVGIEEAQLKLAQDQANQLVQVISAVLLDLGHDLKREVGTREIVRKHLMEAAAIEGTLVDRDSSAA